MKVNFFNQTNENTKKYEKIIKNIFKNISKNKNFNIVFVTLEEIRAINKTYRNIDKETDVISFALCDDDDFDSNDKELGDIFVSLDKAILQANEYQHSIEREVGFLAVHGYLHLCGYDHQTKEDEERMFLLQEKILEEANLKR